jgi:hypothetical protein
MCIVGVKLKHYFDNILACTLYDIAAVAHADALQGVCE